jgi:hypothetical protein
MPEDLGLVEVDILRARAVYHSDRQDYRDQDMYRCRRTLRTSMDRFRQDGILLPYGSSRTAFDTWNLFFQNPGRFVMVDDAEPHVG